MAAETAAALAATSILFADSDPNYSAKLISHAKQLYDFADKYRGKYSDAITDAAGFYKSFTGYEDEIVWGAAWLYRATNDITYLNKAEAEYDAMIQVPVDKVHSFSWDNKTYGSFVLLSVLTGKDIYKQKAEDHLNYWTVGSNEGRVTYSPGGQAWEFRWGSLRHSANTSLLAFIYSDKVSIPEENKVRYHDFAVRQINYALGDNPLNRSYMVGFGNDPANNVHHRAAHGPWANSLQDRPVLPSHILYGALAGGPAEPNDQFVDDRSDYVANEVACDYNAAFTGALARMYGEFGGNPLTDFPIAEIPNREEIRSLASSRGNSQTNSTIKIKIENRTAWPARVTDKLSFRYFIDISEGVNQGFSINDYSVQTYYSQGPSTLSIKPWDVEYNIYYVEASLSGDKIAPIGNSEYRREVEMNIRADNGAPFDASNDFSAVGLGSNNEVVSPNIPVYDDGVLIFGVEPNILSNDEFKNEEFVIYPNPTKDILSIKGNFKSFETIRVDVTGLTGNQIQTINKIEGTNKMSINTNSLQSGLYFLNIYSNDDKINTTKFIKL